MEKNDFEIFDFEKNRKQNDDFGGGTKISIFSIEKSIFSMEKSRFSSKHFKIIFLQEKKEFFDQKISLPQVMWGLQGFMRRKVWESPGSPAPKDLFKFQQLRPFLEGLSYYATIRISKAM